MAEMLAEHTTQTARACGENFKASGCDRTETQRRFSSQVVPRIPIFDYLERLYELCYMTEETFVVSLIYIDRFVRRARFQTTAHEIHR